MAGEVSRLFTIRTRSYSANRTDCSRNMPLCRIGITLLTRVPTPPILVMSIRHNALDQRWLDANEEAERLYFEAGVYNKLAC